MTRTPFGLAVDSRTPWRPVVLLVLVFFGATGITPAASAQDVPTETKPQAQRSERYRFEISTVSFESTYSSSNLPHNITTFRDPFYLGVSKGIMTSANLRLFKIGQTTQVHLGYTPKFSLHTNVEMLEEWLHTVSGAISLEPRRSRWRFALAGGGEVTSFGELFFTQSPAASAAARSTSLAELSTAVLSGGPVGTDITQVGGFQGNPSLRLTPFGRRIGSAGLTGSASYNLSQHLSLNANLGAMHIRHLTSPTDLTGLQYPRVTSYTATANVSYAVRRTTQIGAGLTISQSESDVLNDTGSSGRFFVSHTLRRHWVLQGSIGGGATSGSLGGHNTATYSAGLGFTTRAHSLVASAYRDVSDAYVAALGATSSYFTSATVAWNWKPIRSPWGLSSNFDYFRDAPPGQPAPQTWYVKGTVARRIARNYSLTGQYVIGRMGSRRYIENGRQYQLAQNSIRIGISWSPLPRIRVQP